MTVDFTTCKIVFPCGAVTREQTAALIAKHTQDFEIANFYAEMQIGCNKLTFAVVDLPREAIPKLIKEPLVKDIDLMASYSKAYAKGGDCCTPLG